MANRDSDSCLTALGAVVGIPLLIACSSLWRGYVLSILWKWFIVPVFHLPMLSVPYAIGLSIIVGFLVYQNSDRTDANKSTGELFAHAAALAILSPAFCLATGWVLSFFV